MLYQHERPQSVVLNFPSVVPHGCVRKNMFSPEASETWKQNVILVDDLSAQRRHIDNRVAKSNRTAIVIPSSPVLVVFHPSSPPRSSPLSFTSTRGTDTHHQALTQKLPPPCRRSLACKSSRTRPQSDTGWLVLMGNIAAKRVPSSLARTYPKGQSNTSSESMLRLPWCVHSPSETSPASLSISAVIQGFGEPAASRETSGRRRPERMVGGTWCVVSHWL